MYTDENTESSGMEPQRKALEDMSQALLQKLNAMVAEQEGRAQEFAARVHSLSAQPQGSVLPELQQIAPELPSVPEPEMPVLTPHAAEVAEEGAAAPSRAAVKAASVPPLVRQMKAAVESVPPHRRREEQQRTPARPNPKGKAKGEEKISVVTLCIIGWVLFLVLRSCS